MCVCSFETQAAKEIDLIYLLLILGRMQSPEQDEDDRISLISPVGMSPFHAAFELDK